MEVWAAAGRLAQSKSNHRSGDIFRVLPRTLPFDRRERARIAEYAEKGCGEHWEASRRSKSTVLALLVRNFVRNFISLYRSPSVSPASIRRAPGADSVRRRGNQVCKSGNTQYFRREVRAKRCRHCRLWVRRAA